MVGLWLLGPGAGAQAGCGSSVRPGNVRGVGGSGQLLHSRIGLLSPGGQLP